ncbi:MAG: hypothetical protein J0L69_13025 [Bacteroidetes bacterium]|nr:hypothetical protein [Bacteroidota bacterium]
MKEVIALTDYKGYFESKYNAVPYNSGMDRKLLEKYFSASGISLVFMNFAEVANHDFSFWKSKTVIYTSSEDTDYYYKSFIEDIIYYLELSGARVIPAHKYLRANNNKVFMELLRKSFDNNAIKNMSAKVFGSLEEVEKTMSELSYPLVYKQAAGAMSEGVGLAKTENELKSGIKKIARTKNLFRELWERGRGFKYKGYIQESKFRNKFILQSFVPGLNGDFKVLVFGSKYYVLKRDTKKDDFRASGSGIRNYVKEIPEGMLAYAKMCFETLAVPCASLDIAFDGKNFYLIEFQCLYFGSYTLTYSGFYWHCEGNNIFKLANGKSVLEEEYVRSMIEFGI